MERNKHSGQTAIIRNTEAVEFKLEEDGSKTLWYQKRCLHCGERFISRKSNAIGCTRAHAGIAGAYIKRNGAPKLNYKFKLKHTVDFTLKKYGEG